MYQWYIPSLLLDGNRHTPKRNNSEPIKNTANKINRYASKPKILKGSGLGASGGGLGHESSQSLQEHAGVYFYSKKIIYLLIAKKTAFQAYV